MSEESLVERLHEARKITTYAVGGNMLGLPDETWRQVDACLREAAARIETLERTKYIIDAPQRRTSYIRLQGAIDVYALDPGDTLEVDITKNDVKRVVIEVLEAEDS